MKAAKATNRRSVRRTTKLVLGIYYVAEEPIAQVEAYSLESSSRRCFFRGNISALALCQCIVCETAMMVCSANILFIFGRNALRGILVYQ